MKKFHGMTGKKFGKLSQAYKYFMGDTKQKYSDDRTIVALISGVGVGILLFRWLGGDWVIWVALSCSAAFALETITRVSKERKRRQKQNETKMKLPPKQFKPPKGPKPPTVV